MCRMTGSSNDLAMMASRHDTSCFERRNGLRTVLANNSTRTAEGLLIFFDHPIIVLPSEFDVLRIEQVALPDGFLDPGLGIAVQFVRARGLPGEGDHLLVPAGMDDPRVRPLQRQRQIGEETQDRIAVSSLDP